MKPEKKLLRGLAELSPRFSEARKEPPLSGGEYTSMSDASLGNEENPSRFVCASFISLTPCFDSGELLYLIERLRPAFQKIFYLFLDPEKVRCEALSKYADLPSRGQMQRSKSIFLKAAAPKFTVGYIPRERMAEFRHPPLLLGPRRGSDSGLLRNESGVLTPVQAAPVSSYALAVLDFETVRNSETQTFHPGEMLSALDHCIFVLEICSSQVEAAYRSIRQCISERPDLSCSVFFVGKEASQLGEFVFERLDEISSEFLGGSLGFLGWWEGLDVSLNEELIFEEANGQASRSAKVLLKEMIRSPLLAS